MRLEYTFGSIHFSDLWCFLMLNQMLHGKISKDGDQDKTNIDQTGAVRNKISLVTQVHGLFEKSSGRKDTSREHMPRRCQIRSPPIHYIIIYTWPRRRVCEKAKHDHIRRLLHNEQRNKTWDDTNCMEMMMFKVAKRMMGKRPYPRTQQRPDRGQSFVSVTSHWVKGTWRDSQWHQNHKCTQSGPWPTRETLF